MFGGRIDGGVMVFLMRYLVCILLSAAAGSAAFALGAVIWSSLDPHGAGTGLLFTIPLALAGIAIPGILGTLGLVFRCDLIREPRMQKQRVPLPHPRPRPLPQPAVPPARPAPAPARKPAAPAATPAHDDLELALAT